MRAFCQLYALFERLSASSSVPDRAFFPGSRRVRLATLSEARRDRIPDGLYDFRDAVEAGGLMKSYGTDIMRIMFYFQVGMSITGQNPQRRQASGPTCRCCNPTKFLNFRYWQPANWQRARAIDGACRRCSS